MNKSDSLNEQTRADWRALGFFYQYDEPAATWRIRANHRGLLQFCDTLRCYASDPRHVEISQHEHYGPYGYLKLVTWHEPKIVEDGIYGTPGDFLRLAEIVEQAANDDESAGCNGIEISYSENDEVSLELCLEPDEFDPAEADESLRSD